MGRRSIYMYTMNLFVHSLTSANSTKVKDEITHRNCYENMVYSSQYSTTRINQRFSTKQSYFYDVNNRLMIVLHQPVDLACHTFYTHFTGFKQKQDTIFTFNKHTKRFINIPRHMKNEKSHISSKMV